MAVIAPAGRTEPAALAQGLALLGERYDLRFHRDLSCDPAHGMMAGADADRAAELAWALGDEGVRAIIAARGGYGTTRIVDPALLDALAAAPRLVVGFSDLTALLGGVLRRASLRTIHGPMVGQIGRRGKAALDPLVKLMERPEPPPAVDGLDPVVAGQARGPLVGGNLTMLAHLVGTPLEPDLDGAILFIEDVGERPYRLDRCLTHLDRAGRLAGLRGVIVGQLEGCEPAAGEHDARTVLESILRDLALPSAFGLPAGHGRPNLPLPLGAEVELDGDAGVLRFLEGAVTG